MRIYLSSLLMIVLCLGCNLLNESRQDDKNDNGQQIGSDTKNKEEKANAEFAHIIATEADY